MAKQKTIIQKMIDAEPSRFILFFGVPKSVFLRQMVPAVSNAYHEAKGKFSRDSNEVQQRETHLALQQAIRDQLATQDINADHRRRLYSALCSKVGTAGGHAAHQTWLQPSLPFAS